MTPHATTPSRSTGKTRRRKSAKPSYTIHVITDATGNLAAHTMHAVLTQFPSIDFKQQFHLFRDSSDEIIETVRALHRNHNLIVHALTDPDLKRSLAETCSEKGLPHFDLTGSLVQFLADHTHTAPANELSRLHETNEGYFHRIEAMEFTAQHDDGRRIDTLARADIVIVGLSRVSKSPTATFLGSMGYKVANVSITRETGFPKELSRVKKKIVAFTAQPRALQEVRSNRISGFIDEMEARGMAPPPYCDMRTVVEEVIYAEREYANRKYPVIDITGRTVEELGAKVLQALRIKSKHIAYD